MFRCPSAPGKEAAPEGPSHRLLMACFGEQAIYCSCCINACCMYNIVKVPGSASRLELIPFHSLEGTKTSGMSYALNILIVCGVQHRCNSILLHTTSIILCSFVSVARLSGIAVSQQLLLANKETTPLPSPIRMIFELISSLVGVTAFAVVWY